MFGNKWDMPLNIHALCWGCSTFVEQHRIFSLLTIFFYIKFNKFLPDRFFNWHTSPWTRLSTSESARTISIISKAKYKHAITWYDTEKQVRILRNSVINFQKRTDSSDLENTPEKMLLRLFRTGSVLILQSALFFSEEIYVSFNENDRVFIDAYFIQNYLTRIQSAYT